jgi:hypothetical protein
MPSNVAPQTREMADCTNDAQVLCGSDILLAAKQGLEKEKNKHNIESGHTN